MVRGDEPNPALGGLGCECTPHDDVRLRVHDIGLQRIQQRSRVLFHSPRLCEAQPLVPGVQNRPQTVHSEPRSLVLLYSGAVLSAAQRACDHVHFVPALYEPGGEPSGELCSSIDIWRERVPRDHDAEWSLSGICSGHGYPYDCTCGWCFAS